MRAEDPTYPGYFVEPFMGGLASEALIKYYNYTVAQHTLDPSFPIDTRVPVAVKAFGDWLIGRGPDQPTKTDIEVDSVLHNGHYAIRSVALPFTAQDIQSSVHISSGTGWNPYWYVILTAPDENGWVEVDKYEPYGANVQCTALSNPDKATGQIEVWNAWSPGYQDWMYKIHYKTDVVSSDNIDWGTGSPGYENVNYDNLLNALICPTFGWLYHMYGEAEGSQYREFGDMAFASAVSPARVLFTGKEFSQTYRWTFDYVQWRNDNPWANDTTGPVISQLTTSVLSTTGNYITWKTDEAASTIVDYGLTDSYGTTLTNELVLTNHRQEIAGLTPGQTYHYRITATDSSGNSTYYVGSFTAGLVGPTVSTPAGATPGSIAGTTTLLSVLGDDDGGEANLTYTWFCRRQTDRRRRSDLRRKRHERRQEFHRYFLWGGRLHLPSHNYRRRRAINHQHCGCHRQSDTHEHRRFAGRGHAQRQSDTAVYGHSLRPIRGGHKQPTADHVDEDIGRRDSRRRRFVYVTSHDRLSYDQRRA